MSDDVAAFGFSAMRAPTVSNRLSRHVFPAKAGLAGQAGKSPAFAGTAAAASAPKATSGRIGAAKFDFGGLEMPAPGSYLQRHRASRALRRRSAPGTRDGEDMPASTDLRAPGYGYAERTWRCAVTMAADAPAGIGDTGDANGDEA